MSNNRVTQLDPRRIFILPTAIAFWLATAVTLAATIS